MRFAIIFLRAWCRMNCPGQFRNLQLILTKAVSGGTGPEIQEIQQ
jgi:hypothetical protein